MLDDKIPDPSARISPCFSPDLLQLLLNVFRECDRVGSEFFLLVFRHIHSAITHANMYKCKLIYVKHCNVFLCISFIYIRTRVNSDSWCLTSTLACGSYSSERWRFSRSISCWVMSERGSPGLQHAAR